MTLDGPFAASQRQKSRNVASREAFLAEFSTLTPEQVSAVCREPRSRAASAEGPAPPFGVDHAGRILYPTFQFDDQGRSKASVQAVLRALPPELVQGGWQLALWWVTPTARLGGRRPVDLIDVDPAAVVATAQAEADDWGAATGA